MSNHRRLIDTKEKPSLVQIEIIFGVHFYAKRREIKQGNPMFSKNSQEAKIVIALKEISLRFLVASFLLAKCYWHFHIEILNTKVSCALLEAILSSRTGNRFIKINFCFLRAFIYEY